MLEAHRKKDEPIAPGSAWRLGIEEFGALAPRAMMSEPCRRMAQADSAVLARLETTSLGFRSRYLPYADLTRQIDAWVDTFPSFVRKTSLTKTPQGRDVWLLTIGSDPDRIRPAAWVDGNI